MEGVASARRGAQQWHTYAGTKAPRSQYPSRLIHLGAPFLKGSPFSYPAIVSDR